MSEWIPVKERLPKRAEGGASNWHTDTVIVCMYGNAQYDGYEDFDYEILTGIFVELEDAETGKKELCFEPDRFTLFIPDNWDFFPLDENFETHLPKNECMFLVDDYSDKTEFHDKYFKVLAWMPLPEPYKAESEEKE